MSLKIEVIGKVSSHSIAKNDDLLPTLTALFPEKRRYLQKHAGNSLRITFQPFVPFGPDPEVVQSFLFDNLEEDLQLLVKAYNLGSISLLGFREKRRDSRTELNLSAWELKKLIEVTKGNAYTEQIPLSVFIDPDSVYSFSVSTAMTFHEFFHLADPLKSYSIDDFLDAVDGALLNGDSLISSTPIRDICVKEWGIEGASNFLYSYPDFNRPILMVKNCDRSEEPCINCLACASTCPAGLYPALLYHHLKQENLSEADSMGLQFCMHCRRCSIVCPSNIPLSALIIGTLVSDSGDVL